MKITVIYCRVDGPMSETTQDLLDSQSVVWTRSDDNNRGFELFSKALSAIRSCRIAFSIIRVLHLFESIMITALILL